jgi:flagellar biosynthesis/type III secretory pathway protein FliH
LSSRVLRNAVLLDDAADLVASKRPRRLTALAGDTFSDAYDRGKRDGLAEGQRAADAAIIQLGQQISQAFDLAITELNACKRERTAFLISEAIAIAEFIVGADMSATADVLSTRIEEALGSIDDAPLTIHVSAADVDAISAALDGHSGLTVVADANLSRGEARVTGPWVEADITMGAAIEAVREALA